MEKEKILGYLKEAASKDKLGLSLDNPFREIGFDGGKRRLGWFIQPDFKDIEKAITSFLKIASDKDEFIFVGMGGSINGIKALINFSGSSNIQAIDSLDIQAYEEVLSKVKNLDKTLVCALSKSGTTLETQLIAKSLKELLGENYPNNFLWFSDPSSFKKLDSLGWQDVTKLPLQVNYKEDIGGRFSSPHSLVFLAPLILIFNRNIGRLKDFWKDYSSLKDKLLSKAFKEALKFKEIPQARFHLELKEEILEGFSNWIIQLFQESLGSKIDDFFVKTLVTKKNETFEGFYKIDTDFAIEDKFVYLASLMYYFEVFVALFSYYKRINFVSQPYVEIYKKELKGLEESNILEPEFVDLDILGKRTKEVIPSNKEFIDCVLYFHSSYEFKKKLFKLLSSEFSFPKRTVSIFEGSDWNHHSYQAAFKDAKTFYLIFTLRQYKKDSLFFSKEKAEENIKVLQAISYATFKTLKDKALYLAISG